MSRPSDMSAAPLRSWRPSWPRRYASRIPGRQHRGPCLPTHRCSPARGPAATAPTTPSRPNTKRWSAPTARPSCARCCRPSWGERHRTLAEILRDNGWQTAAYIGGPYLLPDFGLLQGYEHQDIRLPERGKRRADELTEHSRRMAGKRGSRAAGPPADQLLRSTRPLPAPCRLRPVSGSADPLRMTEIDITNGMPMSDEQRAALVDRYDGEVTFLDLHLDWRA